MTWTGAGVDGASIPPGLAGVPVPGTPAAMPLPDPQELLRQQCAEALQRIYGWLTRVVPAVPQFAGVVPDIVQAIRLYEARQYQHCLAQVNGVLQVIAQARAVVPALPPP